MDDVRERLLAHCKRKGLACTEMSTDGAGELVSRNAVNFLLGHSIALNIGCAHEHNIKHAERAIGRLSRMVRCFSAHALDDEDAALLWPEGFACAIEVHNTLPCKVDGEWTSPDLMAGAGWRLWR